MKRNIFIFLCLFLFQCNPYPLFAIKVEWFLPWENRINHLIKDDNSKEIPILFNKRNYRILKIEGIESLNIRNIKINSQIVEAKIYYAPIINDYEKNLILDVLIPIEEAELRNSKVFYFFVEFKGVKGGSENIDIDILYENDRTRISKTVFVSNKSQDYSFSLNNWAYFDYDFLVEGLKNQVIRDLNDHKVNYLIIPPSQFPSVNNYSNHNRKEKLKNYLLETQNKFEYYSIFLGYKENTKNLFSEQWKCNFLNWLNEVYSVFSELNISKDKILLYPFDEPQGKAINMAEEFYDWCRSQNILNEFYVTIGGKDRLDAIRLSEKFEHVQIASSIIDKASQYKNDNTKLLIYTAPGASRSIHPKSYLNLAGRAYLYDAIGIGIWHYSNMNKALESSIVNKDNNTPSWELLIKDKEKDYSLIYRHKNTIYSSIRWKAFSYGYDEYGVFKLYDSIYEIQKAKELIRKTFNNRNAQLEWENIKLEIIKKIN